MGHYDAVAADSCGSSAGDFYVPLASRYYTAFGGCHGALKGIVYSFSCIYIYFATLFYEILICILPIQI